MFVILVMPVLALATTFAVIAALAATITLFVMLASTSARLQNFFRCGIGGLRI